MTPQYIFDTTWKHLVQQGKPVSDRYGKCRYRGEGGTKCAIGALIPDDEYNPEMENRSATHLIDTFFPQWGEFSNLMDSIQGSHDAQRYNQVLDLGTLREEFHLIAYEYKLDPRILDEVR